MKKLLFLSLLIAVTSLRAVRTNLSDADNLKDNLNQAGFEHLVANSNIVERLAGEQKESLAVTNIIEGALLTYYEGIPKAGRKVIEKRKEVLIRAVLKDSSNEVAAVQELKGYGLLQ
jgi:hypothetical protein